MAHHRKRETTVERADSSPLVEKDLDLTIPFHFSSIAREHGQGLQVGDYVRVRGLEKRYELVDIFSRFGSVRVREVGETACILMPWAYVSPWKGKRTSALTQALGNWLFGSNFVYRVSEPDRVLKQRKIHWNRQTCDVEDEDGQVFYDVSWDDLEFWDQVEFHLPDEPN
jgi:hypothetical protein